MSVAPGARSIVTRLRRWIVPHSWVPGPMRTTPPPAAAASSTARWISSVSSFTVTIGSLAFARSLRVEFGPVLGVLLEVVLEDVAGHAVDEHQAPPVGRVLGRVDQDPPGRPAAQAPPRQLGGGVADGKADTTDRGGQRVHVAHPQIPRGEQVVGADEAEGDGGTEETAVDEHVARAGVRHPLEHAGKGDDE